MTLASKVRPRIDKRKVLIVDDHPIVRKGLMQLIAHEPDIEVCGEAEDVAEALEQVSSLRPDLAVIDISLKDSHGIELIGQVKASYPEVKMLVWSMFDEKVFAERALRAGAMGYINKQKSIEKVVDAIRQVLAGEMYLSPRMTNLFLRRLGGGDPLEKDPIRRLTNRELQIFEMIGKGMTTQRIPTNWTSAPRRSRATARRSRPSWASTAPPNWPNGPSNGCWKTAEAPRFRFHQTAAFILPQRRLAFGLSDPSAPQGDHGPRRTFPDAGVSNSQAQRRGFSRG